METNKPFRPSDIKLIIQSIYKRKWLLIIPWIIISSLAVGGSYLIAPQYKASTIISVDSEINLSPGLRQIVGNMGSNNWRRNRAQRLSSFYNEITSGTYLGQLDELLNISSSPGMQQAIDIANANNPELAREIVTLHVLQSSLKDRIEVEFAGENQLKISISSLSAIEAAELTNGLGEIFVMEKHLQRMNLSRLQIDFSDTQYDKFENKLREAIAAKTEFEANFTQSRLRDQVPSTDNQADISNEIYSVTQQVSRYNERKEQYLEQLRNSNDDLLRNPKLVESNVITNLKRSWRNELASMSELILTHPWNSSPVQSFIDRLNKSQRDVENAIPALVDNQYSEIPLETRTILTQFFRSKANIDFYQSRENTTKAVLEELTTRITKIAEDEARLNQLNQDVIAATQDRDVWRTEQETSSISQDLFKDFKYRVIEPARAPLSPFKPNRIQIVVLGMLLGLVIGGASVVLVELMDNSFKKVDEVQAELGLPVLGIAPRMPFLKKVGSKS